MGPFAAADGTFPHDVSFVYELARKPTTKTIRALRTGHHGAAMPSRR
jgi:hypothetical protein